MPALQPPSMQIGALPNGFATVSPLPAGPGLGYGFNDGTPSLIQQVAGASSSAAPATFTLSGITATKAGSFLVFCVAVAESAAPTISTPAGWTAVPGANVGNVGNTLGGRIFVLPNNAGGITSVVITTLTGVNGIATWFGEFANVQTTDTLYGSSSSAGNATYSNGSTTPSAAAYNPVTGPVLLVGMECDVTGQAYTAANVGAGWVTGTPATSTVGATNTTIRPFWTFTSPLETLSYQLAGTLAGSIANGVSLASFLVATSGALLQAQPQGWPGSPSGVMAAWGALGGTKPGGAGGGQ